MISAIASVFSSQGVVVPSTEYVPADPGGDEAPVQAAPVRNDFPVHFEQAATRLELSARAVKAAEEAAKKRTATKEELTPEEEKVVEKLKERDAEVRRHEQAHVAAAAGHAVGGPQYEYQTGPDKKQYAVGGHVDIDMTPVSGNPEATLQKAQAIRRSATSPAEPSGADQAVAAQAVKMAMDATREIAEKRASESASARGSESRRNPYASSAAAPGRFINTYA
jgi:hypothetical protein